MQQGEERISNISDTIVVPVKSLTTEIIIVSTPYCPAMKITKTLGFTWGLIVRSRGWPEHHGRAPLPCRRRDPRVHGTLKPVPRAGAQPASRPREGDGGQCGDQRAVRLLRDRADDDRVCSRTARPWQWRRIRSRRARSGSGRAPDGGGGPYPLPPLPGGGGGYPGPPFTLREISLHTHFKNPSNSPEHVRGRINDHGRHGNVTHYWGEEGPAYPPPPGFKIAWAPHPWAHEGGGVGRDTPTEERAGLYF